MEPSEMETIVRYDYVDNRVTVWTTQKAWMRKCERAGWTTVSESRSKAGRLVAREYEAGQGDIRISVKKVGREKVKTGFAVRKRAAG